MVTLKKPLGLAFGDDESFFVADFGSGTVERCMSVLESPTASPTIAPTSAPASAAPPVDFSSEGGVIAGITLLALTPFIVLVIVLLWYRIGLRLSTNQAANAVMRYNHTFNYNDNSANTQENAVALSKRGSKIAICTIVFTTLIIACAVTGFGLAGYAVYNFVSFVALGSFT